MWKRVVGIAVLACAVLCGIWVYTVHAKRAAQKASYQATNADVCKEALSTYDLAKRGADHAISEEYRQKFLKLAADARERAVSCMAEK